MALRATKGDEKQWAGAFACPGSLGSPRSLTGSTIPKQMSRHDPGGRITWDENEAPSGVICKEPPVACAFSALAVGFSHRNLPMHSVGSELPTGTMNRAPLYWFAFSSTPSGFSVCLDFAQQLYFPRSHERQRVVPLRASVFQRSDYAKLVVQ